MTRWVTAALAGMLVAGSMAGTAWAQDAGRGAGTASPPPEAAVDAGTTPPGEAPSPAPGAAPAVEDGDHDSPGAGTDTPGDDDDNGPPVQIHGYLEAYYGYNLNQPSNGVTAFRYYDSRHDLFTLGNAVLDFGWHLGAPTGRVGSVSGHIALQTGIITEAYDTPRRIETDLLWRIFQEATVSWVTPLGRGLRLDGGLFVIPFGPEEMAAYKNWNWSNSNLFAVAPYQQLGARLVYPLTDRWKLAAGVYNGWDQITTDNNHSKSVSVEATYESDSFFFDAEYYGGVERADGAPEGPWMRHTLDAYIQWQISRRFEVMAHFNGGIEPNRFGTAAWAGGALYGRVHVAPWLLVAVRADTFYEAVPSITLPGGATQSASSIFLDGARWIGSQTVTVDLRPIGHISLRVEYRHDVADGPFFFTGAVPVDPMTHADVPTARSQDTMLAGMTTWF